MIITINRDERSSSFILNKCNIESNTTRGHNKPPIKIFWQALLWYRPCKVQRTSKVVRYQTGNINMKEDSNRDKQHKRYQIKCKANYVTCNFRPWDLSCMRCIDNYHRVIHKFQKRMLVKAINSSGRW